MYSRIVSGEPRFAFRWCLAVMVVAITGTALSCYGPLSSQAWKLWPHQKLADGSVRYYREIIYDPVRALLGCIVAFFLLQKLRDHRAGMEIPEPDRTFFRRAERLSLIGGIAVLLVHALWLGPRYLIKGELRDPATAAWTTWQQVRKPYWPYFLYMLALWMGLAAPVFLALLIRIRGNRRIWTEQSRDLEDAVEGINDCTQGKCAEAVGAVSQALHASFRAGLHAADQYLAIFFSALLMLLWVQLTPDRLMLSESGLDAGKVGLWFLLLPCASLFVGIVVSRQQATVNGVNENLERRRERAHREGDSACVGALDEALDGCPKYGGLPILWTASRKGGVAVPVLVSVASFVLAGRLVRGVPPIDQILLPDFVLQGIQKLFGGH